MFDNKKYNERVLYIVGVAGDKITYEDAALQLRELEKWRAEECYGP